MSKKVGLIVNTSKDPDGAYTGEISGWLLANGCTPMLPDDTLIPGFERFRVSLNEIFTVSDFLAVLGGDGTILQIAKSAAIFGIPVLGINLGTLGYLTDADPRNAFEALSRVVSGDFQVQRRMMLEAKGAGLPDSSPPLALNEFCVYKGSLSRLIILDVFINDAYMNRYRADGVIVSTPTGSTAYNLSAGGPVLTPDGNMIAITPICPHDILARSSVVSEGDVIRVEIARGDNIVFSADGRPVILLETGESVTIRAAKHRLDIITTHDYSFFDVLRRKMSE
ncbi:MAG: NAD(+)/NADH kinase [Clostridiales bacterium]|jgi:NAD+ kinase|nr:NAD(+)/NADH kinase [Clostridiales bacterium]